MADRVKAPRNRTLTLSDTERKELGSRLLTLDAPTSIEAIMDRTINQDLAEAIGFLPEGFVDLLFLDPPYNLNKTFNSRQFKKMNLDTYTEWFDSYVSNLAKLLKPTASVYVCSDWQTSPAVFSALDKYFRVRNRITWEREKGRGATRNWKNSSEDIWFCTVSDEYTFNVDSVKLKRKVIAPYKHDNGKPKDWSQTADGDFRLTHPSNLWTDLTVPFWSMPENTDHPTQKPEKLVAKIVLASSRPGEVVLDPFLGSGTTSVVAKKLHRHFVGIEVDEIYCCLAEKRLALAESNSSIQGYADGTFWERNTLNEQSRSANVKRTKPSQQNSMF